MNTQKQNNQSRKAAPLQTFHVCNDMDGNCTFEIEAETPEDAAMEALNRLGWSVCLPHEREEAEAAA